MEIKEKEMRKEGKYLNGPMLLWLMKQQFKTAKVDEGLLDQIWIHKVELKGQNLNAFKFV